MLKKGRSGRASETPSGLHHAQGRYCLTFYIRGGQTTRCADRNITFQKAGLSTTERRVRNHIVTTPDLLTAKHVLSRRMIPNGITAHWIGRH